MEIYVHVPFCVKKCNYCDFLSAPADDITISSYVNSLVREIRHKADLFEVKEKISSIYVGGGTPSVLNEKQIDAIMRALHEEFEIENNAEITMEVNPKTVDEHKLKFIKSVGINRLSIGMQSIHDDELKSLGRIHSFEDFLKAFYTARDVGFSNINIDVMTALPGQDEKKLESTLKRVTGLNPEHISAYSLIIEPGTPFYETYGNIDGPVVGEELERKLYWQTVNTLKESGYVHYEISNFSKPGLKSRHNCGYWERVEYLGVGLGASSFLSKRGISPDTLYSERTRGETDIRKYIENPFSYSEVTMLTPEDEKEEFFFLGLRMLSGVNLDDYETVFGQMAEDTYGKVIANLVNNELLEQNGTNLRLSHKGIDYGNYVFSQFITE